MATNISKRIFGADLVPEIKEKLKARQKLSRKSEPLDSIQTESENYKSNFLDKDNNIINDLSSRTPFARMWSAVQLQTHEVEKEYDNSNGDYDIKQLREQDNNTQPSVDRIYIQKGDNIIVKKIIKSDTAIYVVGNNKLNNLPINPQESINTTTELFNHETTNKFPTEFGTNNNEFFRPAAGIVSISSNSEGAFGLIKKTTINFTVSNFHDYDEIYSKYFLKPGARIFLDFGWDTSLLYSPKELIQNFKGKELEEKFYGEKGIVSLSSGDLEVLNGNVTEYSSDIKKDGSIDCSLTIVSQNHALVGHNLDEEQEAVKNRILARLDYEVIKFAASHFDGGSSYFSADFDNDPDSLEEFNILAEKFAASNLKHGKQLNLPVADSLRTGVYWQEVINSKGEAVASSGKNLYICWGLFEDLVLNFEFGFGTDYNDIVHRESKYDNSKFDSSDSYIRFDPHLLQRQLFNESATNLVMLYPDKWPFNQTYNSIRGKSPINKFKQGSQEANNFTKNCKDNNKIPLREVFIRVETIKSAFKRANKLSEVLRDIFKQIKNDTYEIINLEMISSDYNYTSIQCIDKNHLYRSTEDINVQDENEWFKNLFEFLPQGPNSIVKDMSLNLSTPSGEMQSMIAINALNPGLQIFPVSSIIDKYLATKSATSDRKTDTGVVHLPSLGNFRGVKFGEMTNLDAVINMNYSETDSVLSNTDEHEIFLDTFSNLKNKKVIDKISKAAEDSDEEEINEILKNNYNGETYEPADDDKDDSSYYNGKVASSLSEYFGIYAKQNFWIMNSDSILPMTAELTIYGISEINPGDLFRIRFLPKIYREKVYFQITKVTNEIGSSGWYTKLETVMRFRSSKKIADGNYESTDNIFISTGFFDKYKHLTDLGGEDFTLTLKRYKSNIKKLKLVPGKSQQSIVSFQFEVRGQNYKGVKSQEENQLWFGNRDTWKGTQDILEYFYGNTGNTNIKTDMLMWSTPFGYGDESYNRRNVAEDWIRETIGNNVKHFGWGTDNIDDIIYFSTTGFAWKPIVVNNDNQGYFIVTFGQTQWLIVPIVGGDQDLSKVIDIWMKIVTYSNRELWPNQSYLPNYMSSYYSGESGRAVKPECIQAQCELCGEGWADVCTYHECLSRGDGHPEWDNPLDPDNPTEGLSDRSYCMYSGVMPFLSCKMNPSTCYYEIGDNYSLPSSYGTYGV